MTVLNKIRISSAIAAVILALVWVMLIGKEDEQESIVLQEYEAVKWLPDKEQWLKEHSDSNISKTENLVHIEQIDAVRISDGKRADANEEFLPREPIKTHKFHIITEDDTLSSISQTYYGTSRHWRKIFEANRQTIGDPDVLPVGGKIVIP